MKLITREIDPNKPMVALSFDDGPNPSITHIVLDVLEENNVAATFFILGIEAERYPDLLNRIIQEGNEIGNHSLNHPDFTKLSDEVLSYQINTTQEIVKDATGYAPLLLRPPYGFYNQEIVQKIKLPIILWSLDTLDWQNRNIEMIYNNIFNNVKDGDIILMHDSYQTTADALKIIIPELISRGYQPVTISELSKYKGIPLESHKVYGNFYPQNNTGL